MENPALVVELVRGNGDFKDNSAVFDSVIGQKEACKKLKFFSGYIGDGIYMPTVLLTGSQGLGKTFLAKK